MIKLFDAKPLCAVLILTLGTLHAETIYLFAGDRSENENADQLGAIHRFAFDSQAPAEITPAPADDDGSVWGTSEGQNYSGLALGPDGDIYAAAKTTKNNYGDFLQLAL